jgi:hypothetical protein
VCGAERAKRRANTSFMPCLLIARSLSLARPADLPAWVMQPVATTSMYVPLCVMYRVHRAQHAPLGSLAPGASGPGCSPEKAPAPNAQRRAHGDYITPFTPTKAWWGLNNREISTPQDVRNSVMALFWPVCCGGVVLGVVLGVALNDDVAARRSRSCCGDRVVLRCWL